MIDLKQFLAGIQQLSEEKGIPREKVIEAVEMALAAAYKKEYGERGQIIKASLDEKTGKFKLEQIKQVVDESMLKPEEELEEGAGEAKAEETKKEKNLPKARPKKMCLWQKRAKKTKRYALIQSVIL